LTAGYLLTGLRQPSHPARIFSGIFPDPFYLLPARRLLVHVALVCKGRYFFEVFEVASKVQAFKQKLKLWESKASIGDISDFECFHNFFQTVYCQTEDTNLE